MSTTTTILAASGILGAGTAVITQSESLTSGQTWTLVGILGAVLAAAIKAIHWICTRFVSSLDTQHDRLTKAIESNSSAVVGHTNEITKLVGELRAQSQQTTAFHVRLDQDRKDAAAVLHEKLDDVPICTADELQRRKLA
ncbi:MAG: hypothetical protein WAT39_03235, partial [Planctomycetota bacterium]